VISLYDPTIKARRGSWDLLGYDSKPKKRLIKLSLGGPYVRSPSGCELLAIVGDRNSGLEPDKCQLCPRTDLSIKACCNSNDRLKPGERRVRTVVHIRRVA
jgi:hypothetical protein